jgi:sulfide:quinone oxidoreductase
MVGQTRIVIAGGGSAGITVAASLRRKNKQLAITLIEPSDTHYYQPGFTLVGAGVQGLVQQERKEALLIPKGVEWIQDRVSGFNPAGNEVQLSSGKTVSYDYLVVCLGLQCDWDQIEGLTETLGKNNVTSNYNADTAEYTFECIKGIREGDAPAIFTQAPMPIKCPGAPQKIVYLASHYFRKKWRFNIKTEFHTATPGIFGVPYYAKELSKVVDSYGIDAHYQSVLVSVDGANKVARFKQEDGSILERSFSMLHVTPPQSAPDVIKQSPLAAESGWMDVDQNSLQSTKFENVFGLGDCTSTPNSKTAAAVRKQAPVVVKNLLAKMNGTELNASYDGYASCPLTTAYGKMMMAEFRYGGQVTPSIPLRPNKSRRSYWWVKTTGLPYMYWDYMLKGYEWDIPHNVNFNAD